MGEVVTDVRMVDPKAAGPEVDRIAFFGHRQRDDLDTRVGQRREEAAEGLRRDQHLADGADHPQALAARIA